MSEGEAGNHTKCVIYNTQPPQNKRTTSNVTNYEEMMPSAVRVLIINGVTRVKNITRSLAFHVQVTPHASPALALNE
jgi:hypothetical protein